MPDRTLPKDLTKVVSGLWTPTLSFQNPGSFILGTPAVEDGVWFNVGNKLIFFTARLAVPVTINDASGYAILSGLPFSSTPTNAQGSAHAVKSFRPLTYPANYTFITGGHTGAGDILFFFEGTNSSLVYVSASHFSATPATQINITTSGFMEIS